MEKIKPFEDRLVEMVEAKKANGEKVNPFFERLAQKIKEIKAQEE